MCEAAAFMVRDGKEELILDSVDLLEPDNGNIRLVNIRGNKKNSCRQDQKIIVGQS